MNPFLQALKIIADREPPDSEPVLMTLEADDWCLVVAGIGRQAEVGMRIPTTYGSSGEGVYYNLTILEKFINQEALPLRVRYTAMSIAQSCLNYLNVDEGLVQALAGDKIHNPTLDLLRRLRDILDQHRPEAEAIVNKGAV